MSGASLAEGRWSPWRGWQTLSWPQPELLGCTHLSQVQGTGSGWSRLAESARAASAEGQAAQQPRRGPGGGVVPSRSR